MRTHSLILCSKTDYESWKNGELVLTFGERFVSVNDNDYLNYKKELSEITKGGKLNGFNFFQHYDIDQYITWKDYFTHDENITTFMKEYGYVVAFGYYN